MIDIICGYGWGIGINIYENQEVSYGFPESNNPFLFCPDYECCTKKEIKKWNEAKKEWKCEHVN